MKKLLTTTALTLTLAIPPMGMAIAESHDSATKVEKSGSATILKNEETGTTVKMSTDGNSAEVTIIDEKAKGDESTKAVETEIEKTDDTMQQAEKKKPEDDMVKSEETVVMEKDEKLENSDDTMKQVEIEKTEKEMVKDGERKSYSWVSRPGPATYIGEGQKGQILASDLIGMRVYAVDRDLDENEFYEESARTDWDDIGEINDLVVGWNGEIQAVILGVGGFLGLGEKDVAVEISSLKRVRERDDSDDWFLVVNSTKDQLENAPTYKR